MPRGKIQKSAKRVSKNQVSEDYDESDGKLSVIRTVYYESGKLSVGEPKTEQGKRQIILPKAVQEILQGRKKISEWIFPYYDRKEEPMHPYSAYRRLKQILKSANLPDIRFHDLRHTFATHALANGVDVKTLSEILGHSKTSFTLDTYTHITDDMKKRASQLVENIMTDAIGKGNITMPKRKNGSGLLRKRADGRWEGRVVVGYDENNLPITKNVTSNSKSECQQKLGELIREYFFDSYIVLIQSYLAVHNIFVPFIDKFLHSKETFLSQKELVNAFNEFNKSQGQNFTKIACGTDSFCYKSLEDERGNDILCEEINFTDLQSFLYFDLFYGIRHNYIPKKCLNCGRYFLIKSGKYFNYCENATEDEPSKTCRDVGARRRYGDKCKNDPIWQTYNRAYKAHYARYMKKKMTISEFEEWSRFASEFRDKAIANSISFEEYFREIRK